MQLEGSLYHYGLGIGIPYKALNAVADAVDSTWNTRDLDRRRQVAEEMLKDSSWNDFLPKTGGCVAVGPNELPGTEALLQTVRKIIEDRRKTGWKARPNNPFYQLERPEDFRDHPALLEFALSDPVLHTVSAYYGMVPQLKEIGIWLTPPQEKQFSSQLYHLDKPECQLVKLFLNVEDNGVDSGPLTLLPVPVSDTVRRKTGYEAIYFRGDGRLTDERVFEHCAPDDQVMLGGVAGSGGFADTSNCFHFGSRTQSGERQMFVIAFMLPHKARDRRTPLFDLAPDPREEAHRLVLSGAAGNK